MKYIGTKIINAQPMLLWEYHKLCGAKFLEADADPDEQGYLVEYTDGGKPNHPEYKGYISWSPKEVFEKAYRPLTGMNFFMVLIALKAGYRVARGSWVDGQFIQVIGLHADKQWICKGGRSGLSNEVVDMTDEEIFATDWQVVE